jgi:hypothetical protein
MFVQVDSLPRNAHVEVHFQLSRHRQSRCKRMCQQAKPGQTVRATWPPLSASIEL